MSATVKIENRTGDVRRAMRMLLDVKAPILGVVENMSWYEASDGSRHRPFGEGGGIAGGVMVGGGVERTGDPAVAQRGVGGGQRHAWSIW